ncbi:hypothetical protein ACE6H2_023995 [Prunus campanulata]
MNSKSEEDLPNNHKQRKPCNNTRAPIVQQTKGKGLFGAATAGLFQSKLALKTSCLGRVFWGDDREGDGEQLLLRNDREIRSLRQRKVTVKLGLRQAASAGLFQPKLVLNSGCLGRVIWGDNREGDGEQLS